MPSLNDLIPDDLELLRIALGEDWLAAARYTLSGRKGHFYCLIEGDTSEGLSMADVERTLQSLLDHSEDPSTYAYEVLDDMMGVVWTNGLEENDPATFAKHELTPINDDYSLDGTMTLFELFSAEDLNAACRLTERQRENIQMTFDRTDAKDFLAAARLVGSHDLERWHAFEVCEAVSAGIPMDFAADIASPELTFKQARGLRYLARTIVNSHMQYDERVRGLFHRVAARTDFAEDKIHVIGSVLKATPRLEFEGQWLDLSTDQLRSVRLAQVENVPSSVLHRYSNGEYPAENMDILTLAARDGQIKGPQLNRLLDPALSLGQLVESWSAAIDCGRGKLSVPAFDLICDPQLPQPLMNALRIGLTYYDMPYSVAATVTPTMTPERIWELIVPEREEVQASQVSHEAEVTVSERSDSGSLGDEAKMSREASGQLSQERATEQAPQREEIE